eukprot:8877494-Alexandrium_andersonii.AAC.1
MPHHASSLELRQATTVSSGAMSPGRSAAPASAAQCASGTRRSNAVRCPHLRLKAGGSNPGWLENASPPY